MANYNEAINIILKNEGGYQNHPNDRGNYNSKNINVGTNYGISATTLERWKGYPVTATDMRNLSQTEANEIYYINYWMPIKGNDIRDQDSANIIFDHSVNAGVGGASKLVQKTLNELGAGLVVDGSIGPKTITRLNTTNPTLFFEEFKKARVNYYNRISGGSNSVFASGWIKRVMDFQKKK